MRKLVLTASLLISSVTFAQTTDLIEFTNGKPANANDVNSNFSNLNERLKAEEASSISRLVGCSGTQINSVEVYIHCNSETNSNETDLAGINTGKIVLKDANNTTLFEVIEGEDLDTPFNDGFVYIAGVKAEIYINNGSITIKTPLLTRQNKLYYLDNSCSGVPYGPDLNSIVKVSGKYFTYTSNPTKARLLTHSYQDANGACKASSAVTAYKLATFEEYTMPDKLLNPTFPLRLEQMP